MLNSSHMLTSPYISFKEKLSYHERYKESTLILQKYNNKIPVICEKPKKHNIPMISKTKFLVSRDLTIGQFIYIIRKFIDINQDAAIFLFIKDTIPPNSACISDIYNLYKDIDGFLYITYSIESTFG
jgi:GABA(A) receptor-associated protein